MKELFIILQQQILKQQYLNDYKDTIIKVCTGPQNPRAGPSRFITLVDKKKWPPCLSFEVQS